MKIQLGRTEYFPRGSQLGERRLTRRVDIDRTRHADPAGRSGSRGIAVADRRASWTSPRARHVMTPTAAARVQRRVIIIRTGNTRRRYNRPRSPADRSEWGAHAVLGAVRTGPGPPPPAETVCQAAANQFRYGRSAVRCSWRCALFRNDVRAVCSTRRCVWACVCERVRARYRRVVGSVSSRRRTIIRKKKSVFLYFFFFQN